MAHVEGNTAIPQHSTELSHDCGVAPLQSLHKPDRTLCGLSGFKESVSAMGACATQHGDKLRLQGARGGGGEGVPVAHAIGISYSPHYLLVALGAGFLELKKKEHG